MLHFFKAAGVEDALSDTPTDAFAAAPKAAPKAQPQTTAPKAQAAPQQQSFAARPKPQDGHVSHEEWLARARAMAGSARNLTELKAQIAAFDGCNLKFTAKNTCIADGSKPQALMLVGEAPGAEEDRQALPFVGRAGQLLNQILAAIGFSRESLQQAEATAEAAAGLPQAYITNAVFWRPPGNRTPTPQEIALCRPFLQRQIELAQPKLIIGLGGAAAAALLGAPQSIMRLRGRWHSYKTADGGEIPYMPSFHPAFLLRQPAQKKAAWQDFLAAKMRLKTEMQL